MTLVFAMGILRDGGLNRQQKELLVRLCFQYSPLIGRILSGSCPPDDREDLIQECFLRLAEHTDRLAELTPPQVTRYVQRVIRSVLIDYRRKKRVYISLEDCAEELEDSGCSPELFCEQRETFARFHQQWGELPTVDQDLFYLKYLLELPDEEIAQRLGISPGSVRTYLSRARKHARKLIKLD